MTEQNRRRPSLAPLQTSQLEAAAADGKSTKRLRGTSRVYSSKNSESDYKADGCVHYSFPSSKFRARQPDPYSFISRHGGAPLPPLKWANREEVWYVMCWKEQIYAKDSNLLQRHPQIAPKMRSVLFEWISEVCEVYKLHRETFYLSMDFVDRYLSEESHVPKSRLQLIGVTALFIAAKLEEIYPPQAKDFAYVTDQACTVEEILDLELRMLRTLKWALCPATINHWLMLYLQIIANEINSNLVKTGIFEWRCREFLLPQFQRLHFIRLMQLADLCSLDAGVLRFPYSVVAASAFFHILQPMQLTLLVSGYVWSDLESCITWMTPFAQVIKEQDVNIKVFTDIPHDDMHNIQSHFVAIALLEKAQSIASLYSQNQKSPATTTVVNTSPVFNIFPTPPRSDERSQARVSRLTPDYTHAKTNR